MKRKIIMGIVVAFCIIIAAPQIFCTESKSDPILTKQEVADYLEEELRSIGYVCLAGILDHDRNGTDDFFAVLSKAPEDKDIYTFIAFISAFVTDIIADGIIEWEVDKVFIISVDDNGPNDKTYNVYIDFISISQIERCEAEATAERGAPICIVENWRRITYLCEKGREQCSALKQ